MTPQRKVYGQENPHSSWKGVVAREAMWGEEKAVLEEGAYRKGVWLSSRAHF